MTKKKHWNQFLALYEEVLDQFGEMEKFMFDGNIDAAFDALDGVPDQLKELSSLNKLVGLVDGEPPDQLSITDLTSALSQKGVIKGTLRSAAMIAILRSTTQMLKTYLDLLRKLRATEVERLVERMEPNPDAIKN